MDQTRLPASVGVIITAKDAADTIGKAVASALQQAEAAEIIVIDDGSSDGTAAAAEAADDGSGRLRVFRMPRNVGPSAARNHALERCTAEHVAVLDADDFFLPGRLRRMLLAVQGQDWDMVADDILVTTDRDGGGPYTGLLYSSVPHGPVDLAAFVRGNRPSQGHEFGYLKPIIRRDFMVRHGIRYDETMYLGEDYALYAELLAHRARLHLIGGCGYIKINLPTSLSNRHTTSQLLALVRADDRLAALPGLTAEERRLLLEHRAHTEKNYLFRALLDAKRAGRPHAMLLPLLRNPAAVAYIARALVQAKLNLPVRETGPTRTYELADEAGARVSPGAADPVIRVAAA